MKNRNTQKNSVSKNLFILSKIIIIHIYDNKENESKTERSAKVSNMKFKLKKIIDGQMQREGI